MSLRNKLEQIRTERANEYNARINTLSKALYPYIESILCDQYLLDKWILGTTTDLIKGARNHQPPFTMPVNNSKEIYDALDILCIHEDLILELSADETISIKL